MASAREKAVEKAKGGAGKGPYPRKEMEVHEMRKHRGEASSEKGLASYRRAKKYYKASGTSAAHFHHGK